MPQGYVLLGDFLTVLESKDLKAVPKRVETGCCAGDRARAVAVQAYTQHMMGTQALESPWCPFLP